jgi:hypothetical protein
VKKKYKVLLPIDIGGRVYQFGETAELDIDAAVGYAHALLSLDDARVKAEASPAAEALLKAGG